MAPAALRFSFLRCSVGRRTRAFEASSDHLVGKRSSLLRFEHDEVAVRDEVDAHVIAVALDEHRSATFVRSFHDLSPFT